MKPPVELLAASYQNNLYATAFNLLQSRQDAEDVVQDTLIQYISCKKEFESEEHVRAWLFRVAINLAKNRRRSFFRHDQRPLDDYADTLSDLPEESSDLFEAVMALPEKYRIVIHLFYYEDYSVNEIAEILNLRAGNVKVRLSRGRQLLKNTLKEAWSDDE